MDVTGQARSFGKGWFAKGSYSDIVLALAVVVIITIMIIPLPLLMMDILLALNILISIGLLLLAIYIPAATSFSSFPSVILLTTLFRLSLSIATTRLIMLDADAGDIIETFGVMAVGGNIVVGFVVFIIITVVQFIVIAKGAERVAEVAARFTLDAMPGKQLSIDSDLRSGLLNRDDAKAKRKLLELESQLHGSLDGAMKFVKGDAIAGIVILIVNIVGGLTIGILQRGMSAAEAAHTYSILTIGDGLVAQIPALLTSISAGLIITRNANDGINNHLGVSISSQVTQYPRVILIGGFLSLLMMLVPGFPWPVFLVMGLALIGIGFWKNPLPQWQAFMGKQIEDDYEVLKPLENEVESALPQPLELKVNRVVVERLPLSKLTRACNLMLKQLKDQYGALLPDIHVESANLPEGVDYQLFAHGVRVAQGRLQGECVYLPPEHERFLELSKSTELAKADPEKQLPVITPPIKGVWLSVSSTTVDTTIKSEAEFLIWHLRSALLRNLHRFMGIQETANLINLWNEDYPDLIKEMLRNVAPQQLSESLSLLLKESVSIRNLRDIFELITELASFEKNVVVMTEKIRVGLKRQISDHFADVNRHLYAIVIHPEVEDSVRQSVRDTGNGKIAADPNLYKNLLAELNRILEGLDADKSPVILCSFDVRRQFRLLIEDEHFELAVISYQELASDINVTPLAQLTI